MHSRTAITFLISTFNRRDVLLNTLEKLRGLGETIVVDNASTDGTTDAVRSLGGVKLIALHRNSGACAKNVGLAEAAGEFVVFLDDDSYPIGDSVRRMIRHFRSDPSLGAAVFEVILPDGNRECSAYPSVVIGCGTGFRRSALLEVGALPVDFFMQAEEYDLSLKLLQHGWKIRRFDDLSVRHLKTPGARVPKRTTRLDVRNNVMLVTRYFPGRWVVPFAVSWTRRYWSIAKTNGHRLAAIRGLIEGVGRSLLPGHRRAVDSETFETFAMIDSIRRTTTEAVGRHRAKRVVLIDWGKNSLPFFLAARACGVKIVAVADDRLVGSKCRGVPVVSDAAAMALDFDLAVVANSSPVHAADRAAVWRAVQTRPVLNVLESEDLPLRVAA